MLVGYFFDRGHKVHSQLLADKTNTVPFFAAAEAVEGVGFGMHFKRGAFLVVKGAAAPLVFALGFQIDIAAHYGRYGQVAHGLNGIRS